MKYPRCQEVLALGDIWLQRQGPRDTQPPVGWVGGLVGLVQARWLGLMKKLPDPVKPSV